MRELVIDVPPQELSGDNAKPNLIRFANSATGNRTPIIVNLPENYAGKRLLLKTYRYKINTVDNEDISVASPYFLVEFMFNGVSALGNNTTMVRSYTANTAVTAFHSNLMALPFSSTTSAEHGNWGVIHCPQTGALNLGIRLYTQIAGVLTTSYDAAAFEYLVLWFDVLE